MSCMYKLNVVLSMFILLLLIDINKTDILLNKLCEYH